MRLIDADVLPNIYTATHQELILALEEAPTIDAVPVIRCKDCKFWCKGDGLELTNDGEEFHHCWELVGMVKNSSEALVPWNHFCAWAERKES